MRVSDSEEIDYDTTLGITAAEQGDVKLPPPDPRYDYRHEYKFDNSKRIIERKQYGNRGELNGVYNFTYQDDLEPPEN